MHCRYIKIRNLTLCSCSANMCLIL